MKEKILLTGVTGNLGSEMIRATAGFRATALVRRPDFNLHNVTQVAGDLVPFPSKMPSDFNIVIHAAADTRFAASRDVLWRTNVVGTARLIEFARTCSKLERFIYISTTCIWGDTVGRIDEVRCPIQPGFHNLYEESKWEAERLLFESGLPVQVIRLPIVIGSEQSGSIRRNGAIHHALRWIARSLLPVIPGHPEARLDLVSTEYVGRAVRQLLVDISFAAPVIHLSLGERAPLLQQVLAELGRWTHERFPSHGELELPVNVDLATYRLFRDLVTNTGDALFNQIYQTADGFLSSLLYPKTFQSTFADRLRPPSWTDLCHQVFDFQITPLFAGKEPLQLGGAHSQTQSSSRKGTD